MGFTEGEHYVQVYANHYTDPQEPDRVIGARQPGLRLISAFLHASITDEQRLRCEFTRVHVCRRFSMTP